MNGVQETARNQGELPPLFVLLTAYAPATQREWIRLCWLLDQRLAAVVRRGGEPTIAAIRLAWWHEVLVDGDLSKGRGEPLVEAWRAVAPAEAAPGVERLIDGWRVLLGSDALTEDDLIGYAEQRGGALFGLIGGTAAAGPVDAGALWALWDLAGHARDDGMAQAAIGKARDYLRARSALPRASAPKILRLLHAIAAADVRAGRIARGGFEGRHYRALLWRGLLP